jgi:predicted DNA-binding protein
MSDYMTKNKHISIRINEETLRKFHYVSQYDGRTANGHMMYLINKTIRDFEEKHGRIELEDEEKGCGDP